MTSRPISAASRAVISDLREVIASGTFIHAEDESACKFCDYGPACGSKARANSAPMDAVAMGGPAGGK